LRDIADLDAPRLRLPRDKGSTQKAAIVKLPHIERIAEEVAAGASLLVRAQLIVERSEIFKNKNKKGFLSIFLR
jgi:hypothetical protein